jgi:catalase
VKDQYRHCKPILVLGAAASLLDEAGVPPTLPTGAPDPGLLQFGAGEGAAALEAFVQAIAKHRHFERETDPPVV